MLINLRTVTLCLSLLIISCVDHRDPQPSPYTAIPDINFEKALIDLKIDDIQDGIVLTANAKKVTRLYIFSKGIQSLVGIEAFTGLTDLYCFDNKLNILDISKNTALQFLYCSNNKLTILDVSNNTALVFFDCSYNELTSLDVSKNNALGFLACLRNSIQTICVNSLNQVKLSWLKDASAIYKVCP